MQQEWTDAEAVFWKEVLCQILYGIVQVFEWFCFKNTEGIKNQVTDFKKIWGSVT